MAVNKPYSVQELGLVTTRDRSTLMLSLAERSAARIGGQQRNLGSMTLCGLVRLDSALLNGGLVENGNWQRMSVQGAPEGGSSMAWLR